ncbi:MAG: MerC family mercury resistance protein, partial [Verrucomicrobiota bacterium]|nr:MerC family mercury resistance protein [Verrucomicrobiota bacterium]
MKTSGWTKLDKLGMTLSFLCAVHCLFMPILLP